MRPTTLKKPPARTPIAPLALLALVASAILGGCTISQRDVIKEVLENKPVTTAAGGSTATSVDEYKRELGQRIQQVNSTKVYVVRPQALLRSVIVVRFVIDAQGGLVRSEIDRTNHDKETEAIAVASLRNTAPFPKPPQALLKGGRLEISESWLFNNDGKFQLRSVAMQQLER